VTENRAHPVTQAHESKIGNSDFAILFVLQAEKEKQNKEVRVFANATLRSAKTLYLFVFLW
jgi:hypothetical protein